jgi:hypothetical protein
MIANSKGLVLALTAMLAPALSMAEPTAPMGPIWSLAALPDDVVAFQGQVDMDQAGLGTGGMLYPAPGPIGFLAAVVTHGLLNENSKNRQKTQLQETADKVLEPYREILAGLRVADLQRRALALLPAVERGQLLPTDQLPSAHGVVLSVPVFSMTQDQRALVLDASVSVRAPGGVDAAWAHPVRVIWPAAQGAEPQSHWKVGDGETLKASCAAMLAESVDIGRRAVRQTSEPDAAAVPYKTYRFKEGGRERFERAQIVSADCDRLVLRTLRGAIISAPRRDDDRPETCPLLVPAPAALPADKPAAGAVPASTAASGVFG